MNLPLIPAVARELGVDRAGRLRRADKAAHRIEAAHRIIERYAAYPKALEARSEFFRLNTLCERHPWTACQVGWFEAREAARENWVEAMALMSRRY